MFCQVIRMKISINNLTITEVAKIASKMGWAEVALTTDRGFAYLEREHVPQAAPAPRALAVQGIESIF